MLNPPAKMVNVRRVLALAGALLLGNSLQADVDHRTVATIQQNTQEK